MLQTYAPNCWAYLHSHPDTLASVMNPDGTIYALPQVNSGAKPLSEWDSYTAQLGQLKIPEMLAIYQAAVDRYHALNTALK